MDFDNKTISEIRETLTYGQCYPTAMAMNEILGWPIGGLLVLARRSSWNPHLVHTYLIAPDGRAFDASGFRTLEEIHEDFLAHRPGKDFSEPQFVTYADAQHFRHALRLLYEGREVQEVFRSEYDDFLDEHVPSVVDVLNDRLEIAAEARREFPHLGSEPTYLTSAIEPGW